MVVRSVPSRGRGGLIPSTSGAPALHRRLRLGLGSVSWLRPSLRLLVSRCFTLFHQPTRASGCLPCHSGFSPSPQGKDGVFVHRQHVGSVIPPQGGRHALVHAQLSGSGDSPPLRGFRCSSAPPVCSGSPECLGGLSQSARSGPWFRMDPPSGGVPRSLPPLAGHGGFIRHLHQPSPSGLFFPDGRPSGGGVRCADPTLGSSSGLCLPSVQPYPEGPHQGPRLPQSRDDSHGSLLAFPALVSRSPRPTGRGAGPSSSSTGSTPSAPLPPVSREPPRAGADWVSHCQRSARHFGFSARVVRQLAFSRRHSTRLNYQSKWSSTFRTWCLSHGHSVSCPTVPKIADFLLYLRRSLLLSYSTIASYHSMLSATFRFVLPELSSHPVLHDLRSFRIECPLSSSHFPTWDLLRVLSLLRGSPFEPLESCSLRDLFRKTLFFLSLATAHRVGELQAVSSSVSSSGGDLFLSYLPEFRAKMESSSNPLPRSFRVRSLRDFVGSLPDELSLCPVCALQIYLHCTSSLSPCPRSLFVSPRAPSRSLSKNALSFFLRSVISLSFPPSSHPPSSSSRPHSIRAISTSAAFSRMFLSPLSLLPRLGVLLLSSLLSICVMSSSLPLLGFRWVLWWWRMRLFSILLCVGVGFC